MWPLKLEIPLQKRASRTHLYCTVSKRASRTHYHTYAPPFPCFKTSQPDALPYIRRLTLRCLVTFREFGKRLRCGILRLDKERGKSKTWYSKNHTCCIRLSSGQRSQFGGDVRQNSFIPELQIITMMFNNEEDDGSAIVTSLQSSSPIQSTSNGRT